MALAYKVKGCSDGKSDPVSIGFLCAWTKEKRDVAIKKNGKINNLVAPPSDH